MKLSQSILLAALTIGSSRGQWDSSNSACNNCAEKADKFKQCTQDFCKDATIDGTYYEDGDCLLTPIPTSGIPVCCNFSYKESYNECTEASEGMEDCLDDCLPACVEDTMINYMDCVIDEDSCGLEDCVTKIALENDFAGVSMEDNDKFFKELAESLENTSEQNAMDCDIYERKKAQICDVGTSCCESCNRDLGDMMECITNKMILPWQAENNNVGDYDECDMDRCDNRRRQLDGHVTNTTHGTHNELTNECIVGMKFNVALGKKEEAGQGTMNCMVVNGARALEEDKEEAKPETGSSAAQARVLSAFLIAMAASILA